MKCEDIGDDDEAVGLGVDEEEAEESVDDEFEVADVVVATSLKLAVTTRPLIACTGRKLFSR